jgi:hypothetical protein
MARADENVQLLLDQCDVMTDDDTRGSFFLKAGAPRTNFSFNPLGSPSTSANYGRLYADTISISN